MAGGDITVEILKDIRDAVRATNTRLDVTNARLDSVESTLKERLDSVESTLDRRFDVVEGALLDLAEQHRFVVRRTTGKSAREARLEPRLSALESRVNKLESK